MYENGNFDFHITGTLSEHEHYMMVLDAMVETKTKQSIVEKAEQCF